MQVVSYQHESVHLDNFIRLTGSIYREYAAFARAKTKTALRSLATINPFFKHGACTAFLAYEGDVPLAHSCAITDGRLSGIGLIGFFEAVNDPTAAHAVLDESARYLAERGVAAIRAPVDLTTWNGFRFACSDEPAPFYTEPFNPSYYPGLFRDFGFRVAQRNISTIHSAQGTGFDRFKRHLDAAQRDGFSFEHLTPDRLRGALPAVHSMLAGCFGDSWCFVPISLSEFEYNLTGVAEHGDGNIFFLAFDQARRPVGFCLAALDWPGDQRCVIVKSVAAIPGTKRLAVARALLNCVYQEGVRAGASEFILSTMRDDNLGVRALIPGWEPVFRRYETYEMTLPKQDPNHSSAQSNQTDLAAED